MTNRKLMFSVPILIVLFLGLILFSTSCSQKDDTDINDVESTEEANVMTDVDEIKEGEVKVVFLDEGAEMKYSTVDTSGTDKWVPVTLGKMIGVGDELRTSKDVSIELLFPDGSVIKIAPETHIVFKDFGIIESTKLSTSTIKLMKGKVRAFVYPLINKSSKFNIETENATVGVRGTDFGVTHDLKTNKTKLVCLVGEVGVQSNDEALKDNEPIPVKKDEAITVVPNAAPSKPVRISRYETIRFFGNMEFEGVDVEDRLKKLKSMRRKKEEFLEMEKPFRRMR
jgi:FecR protein